MADLNVTLRSIALRIRLLEEGLRKVSIRDAGGGYWITIGGYKHLSPHAAGGTYEPFLSAIPRDCTIKKFVIATNVITTNNASHYWTITLQNESGVLSTLTTASDTASVWTPHTVTSFSGPGAAQTQATHKYWYVNVESNGTPGSLFLAAPSIFFI